MYDTKEKLLHWLNQELENSSQQDVFWETIIAFIEQNLRNYVDLLREKGFDPALLSVNKQNGEETTKEKLLHIQKVLTSLAKLNSVLDQRKEQQSKQLESKIERLENELKEKTSYLKEKEDELTSERMELQVAKDQIANFKTYKDELDKRLSVQPKQITNQLSKKLQVVRDRINMIQDLVVESEFTDEKFTGLQSKISDAVQTIVGEMSNWELWPKEEKKPEPIDTIKVEKVKKTRISKRKKNDVSSTGHEGISDQIVDKTTAAPSLTETSVPIEEVEIKAESVAILKDKEQTANSEELSIQEFKENVKKEKDLNNNEWDQISHIKSRHERSEATSVEQNLSKKIPEQPVLAYEQTRLAIEENPKEK